MQASRKKLSLGLLHLKTLTILLCRTDKLSYYAYYPVPVFIHCHIVLQLFMGRQNLGDDILQLLQVEHNIDSRSPNDSPRRFKLMVIYIFVEMLLPRYRYERLAKFVGIYDRPGCNMPHNDPRPSEIIKRSVKWHIVEKLCILRLITRMASLNHNRFIYLPGNFVHLT